MKREKNLVGDKWKFLVTLDEEWPYLNDYNKKEECLLKQWRKSEKQYLVVDKWIFVGNTG